MPGRWEAASAQATARAGVRWLLAQAALGFPGLAHVLRPRRARGWPPGGVEHRGEAFTQAVLGCLLLDIAEALHRDAPGATALRAAARKLADQVADACSPALAGGWRYFPHLTGLPPDLDSLGAALTLFARAAPPHLLLTHRPLALALALQRPDGAVPLWLIGPDDPLLPRLRMQWHVRWHRSGAMELEAAARFASALRLIGGVEAGAAAHRLSAWVAARQRADGSWPARRYAGDAVAAGLALAAVAPLDPDARLQARTLAWLQAMQQRDGGWGTGGGSAPLDTAVAVALLRQSPDATATRARGIAFLCERQTAAGHWKATPWIRVDIGGAAVSAEHGVHGSAAISTAACVRTLLQVSAREAAQAAQASQASQAARRPLERAPLRLASRTCGQGRPARPGLAAGGCDECRGGQEGEPDR